jgi:hypothetical protein
MKTRRTYWPFLMLPFIVWTAGCKQGSVNSKLIGGTPTDFTSFGDGGGDTGTGPSDSQSAAMTEQAVDAAMGAYTNANLFAAPAPGTPGPNHTADSINQQISHSMAGPSGGNMAVSGSVTGNMTWTQVPLDGGGHTHTFNGATVLIQANITATDYSFTDANNTVWTMNGDPYMTVAGSLTIDSNFAMSPTSHIRMGGGMRFSDNAGNSGTIQFNITSYFNSAGNGGTMSGTVTGTYNGAPWSRTINETF